MAISKLKNAIKRFSGGVLCALPIADEDAGGKSTDTGWLNLGYVKESILEDMTEIEELVDETGNVVATDETVRTVKLTGRLMQSDADTIEFFNNTVRGNYYMVYHYDGVNNGKWLEYWFGICKIKPQIRLQSGEKEIPFEITVMYNVSNIPFGDTGEVDLPTEAKSASLTGDISAGTYYEVTATTVT